MPTIGVATVMAAAHAGLAGIVGEAGALLVVDRQAVIQRADDLGLFVVGVPRELEEKAASVSAPLCIMLVAGEASGDALARSTGPCAEAAWLGDRAVRFVGVGGAQMAAEGVQSPFDYRQVTVLGLFEGLLAYRRVVARVQ